MRVAHLLAACAAAGSVFAVQTGIAGNASLTSGNSTVIPKRFIIEVAQVRNHG